MHARTPTNLTAKLAALHYYELSIPAPKAKAGSFDARSSERGHELFSGKAKCATCHVPPLYTEPGQNLHAPAEVCVDAFQAAAAKGTTPCWKTLINDWYDGRIDGTYPIHCYRDALKHLPTDVETYSSARDDIKQALQKRLTQGTNGGGTTTTTGGGTTATVATLLVETATCAETLPALPTASRPHKKSAAAPI